MRLRRRIIMGSMNRQRHDLFHSWRHNNCNRKEMQELLKIFITTSKISFQFFSRDTNVYLNFWRDAMRTLNFFLAYFKTTTTALCSTKSDYKLPYY